MIRLHAFLEHWGIINFNVSTFLRPPKLHLSCSDAVPQSLAEIVQKGYLKLQDSERLQYLMQRENTTGPYENFTFISALKTNALSKRRPTCIQCGQLCHLVWYAYTQQTAKEILASKQRELKSIEFFGESDSLH